MSALPSRVHEKNHTAQLAAQFNDFYLAITSPQVSQIGNYRIVEEIGEGAFGKVYLAQHVLLNAKVVLKCGLLDDPNIVREIYYHQLLKHKHITKLYEVIKTELHIWMALEYCEGGELFYYIYENRRLEIDVCRRLFYQIVNGIKYVHSLNLAHRDLKLENILLADRKKLIVKLTDFGFVREFNPYKRLLLSTVCGTTAYMAPEMLKLEKYSGFAVDIWSMGVILYAMVFGELPFDDDDDMQMKLKIINDDPVLPMENVDPHALELIQKMLLKDPAARPSVLEILNSPFIIDLTNEHSERRASSNDAESIISINQHYKENKIPFQTRIERELLKKLEKLHIDTDQLQESVIQGHTNTLTAFYELGLTREFKKKKYKHKRRRYYEAKRQIKKSRKRVRSALSLPDQGSGTQPLEKIISTLSIGSNRGTNDGTANGSRRSTEEFRKPTSRTSFNKRLSARLSDSLGTNVPQTPLLVTGNDSYQTGDYSLPHVDRQVSFIADDRKSAFSYQPSSEQQMGKGKKILGKLQFWKKGRKDQRNDENGHTSMGDQSDGEQGNDNEAATASTSSPLDLRKSNSPKQNGIGHDSTDIDPLDNSHKDEQFGLRNDLRDPAQANGTADFGHQRQESNQTSNTNNTGLSHASDSADKTNHSLTQDSFLSTVGRKRPESVVSQISQFSQLSHPYPMSESELEMMDGTDMEEYYYDDDGIYELSINNSQQDILHSKHGLTSMAPSNSSNLKKMRPSTSRMASDALIMTSSTQATGHQGRSKKNPLSQVSSNSSDDSKYHEGSYFDRPLLPRQKQGFARSGTHPPLGGARQTFFGKLPPSPGVHTPSPVNLTAGNGMGRSPSPPIFKKIISVKTVSEPKKGENTQSKWTFNDQNSAENRWRFDGTGPRPYERQAIITEEDEEE